MSNLQDAASHRNIAYQQLAQHGGMSYPKDLTAVLVDANREPIEFGYQARRRWERELNGDNRNNLGYAIRFKMALRSEAPESDIPQFHGSLAGSGNDAVLSLIAAQLRHLRDAALRDITAAGHRGIAYAEDDIRWCVTVPAIWSDPERELMRHVAAMAGLPASKERLFLVTEPEAAAVYCAMTMGTLLGSGRPDGQLDVTGVGSRFMVVDCGGGTVDITTYQIRPEGVGDQRLGEIGIANGGPLGSAYINHAFLRDLLADRFGADRLADLTARFPKEIGVLEDDWELQKVSLDSETGPGGAPVVTAPFYVTVPGRIWTFLDKATRARLTKLASGDTYTIVITPEEVAGLFDSVVEPILDTIEQQRKTALDTGPVTGLEQIIVVGGFARSTYLRDSIEHRFGDSVRVLMPQDPAVAVLGGAVHFAYDPTIIWGRRAKYTYGYACSKPFRPGVDPKSKYFKDEDNDDRCNHRFHIMIRRGDVVPVDKPFHSTLSVTGRMRRTLDIKLYVTYAAEPQYVDEPGCEQIGTASADISGSVGRPSRERDLEVSFYCGRTEIEVLTRDHISGKKRRATIEFHDLYGRRGRK